MTKNTAQHTPGPWITSTVHRNDVLACGTGAARVAQCLDEFDDNPGGPKFGTGEVEANAALISAAPELLAAIRDIVNVWEGPRDRAAFAFAGAIVKARAAIAKAEGKN